MADRVLSKYDFYPNSLIKCFGLWVFDNAEKFRREWYISISD